MARIILDAMGGDHAPDTNLDGVALAIERGHVRGDDLLLVGKGPELESQVKTRSLKGVDVAHAEDELTGTESPVEAMRRKPNSSVAVGLGLVKQGVGDAFVSAGNTGLVVATATVGLGMLEGVRRPGIGVVIEGDKGPFMVIDVGANPQPKPQHMLINGIMGSAYFHDTFGVEEPRVALMNIGSEDKKGNPLILEGRQLLRDSKLNFIGNVEGVDLFRGQCDVVVCDGFTGNVLLKVSEGVAEHVLHAMAGLMGKHGIEPGTIQQICREMADQVDYSSYGGALLLGVNGIVTICHGRSQGPAICNAIRFAHQAVGAGVNEHIVGMARDASGASEAQNS